MTEFGNLKLQNDLTTHWADEARDFTPWLAENLQYLGQELGIELEEPLTEVFVGSKKADIICQESGTGDKVVIENQLDDSDHKHMGQLMLYAAGLDAKIVVWVARTFSEEHRAALDWLNRITKPEINFFGVQIEVWQIDESKPAPKFNVVCNPNNWEKSARSSLEQGPLNETQVEQVEFWQAFRDEAIRRSTVIRPRKPQPQYWMDFSIGRADFNLTAHCLTKDPGFRAGLYIADDEGSKYLEMLLDQKAAIESRCGPLDWTNRENTKHKRIIKACPFGLTLADKDEWPKVIGWLLDQLICLHEVLQPIVKGLDLADYQGNVEDLE